MTAFAGELLLVRDLASRMRAPKIRTLTEFAEEEIVLPDGPFQGFRLKLSRSPAARLLYRELDAGRWKRAFVTGPNQDGKSLFGFVIPTLHALFERKERVILGVPSLDMVGDKWRTNLLPVIMANPLFRDQLPGSGSGSRGGDSILFEFRNGASLRFMTAGGNDQSRAGMSTPNLIVTETDGFDMVGGSSREGDKFAQLERRTLAHDDARILAECTVSTATGRTWREIQHGTASRIALRCPQCSAWVTPEREHLTGWQDAASETEAADRACLACPACGAMWTNQQRIDAHADCLLVHRGQEVDPDGVIVGDPPPTDTLGFRWTVVNSVLNPRRVSMVGAIEWKALRAPDEEVAERDVLQSQWAMPAKSSSVEVSQLDYAVVMQRLLKGMPRGRCPSDTQLLTVGIDVGKWLVHWDAIAWRPNATPHVPEYGVAEVPADTLGEEQALLAALRTLRDEVLLPGWQLGEARVTPTLVFVDAGYQQAVVHQFCAESGPQFFAVKGYGVLQRRSGSNARVTGSKTVHHGDKYTVARLPGGELLAEVNVDVWKSWLHARLRTPLGQPGALTLFDPHVSAAVDDGRPAASTTVKPSAANVEHLSYAKHLMAEKQVEDWDPKDGAVVRWEAVSRKNHYLDATMLACVAGHAAGVRLLDPAAPPQPAASAEPADDGVNPLTNYRRWTGRQ